LFLLRSNGKKKARTLVKQYDLTLDSVFVAEWKNKQNMKMVDVVGSVSRFVEV
jgi:hypothetical protein